MNDVPSRRRFLAGFGGVGLAGLAGCLSFGDGEPERPPEQWLEVLYVTNRDTRPWDVDVAVLRAEEVVLWETYAIEKRADGVVDGAEMRIPEFDEKSSDWVVIARLQDGDATTYVDVGSISQQVTAVTLELRITPDAEFRTLVDYSDS